MNKTQIHNMIDEAARWVRARYHKGSTPAYNVLLTQAARAACRQLHGDDHLGVGAMKSAISSAHWRLRRKVSVGIRGYQQGLLPF